MMLLLQSGMIGAFVSADLFLFFIFWEVMLVPMYFLIGIWGGKNRLYSAIKFFLYTLVGSVVMLLAVLKLFFIFPDVVKAQRPAVEATARQLAACSIADPDRRGQVNSEMLTLVENAMRRVDGLDAAKKPLPPGYSHSSFNIAALTAIGPHIKTVFGMGVVIFMFVGFALSFAIKVPMFPFHTWLPDAHVEAPTAGSVILAGVLLKMGTYGFIRFSLPLLPQASSHPTVVKWMVVLSIIAIIYGALVSLMQRDMKKLIAYSSVSHLGFCTLGIFALNPHGLSGSVIQQINHGISTGALFLIVGLIYERRHTREIKEFGGLSNVMPVYATLFMIVMLSSIGLPLLNGFIGEFTILQGAFEVSWRWAAWAVTGIVLGAAYMLWLYQRTMFGTCDNPKNQVLKDLNFREIMTLVPLIIWAFWIGIYPKPFFKVLEKPVTEIVRQVNAGFYPANAATTPDAQPAPPPAAEPAPAIATPAPGATH
ncbi:MAG: complex I subunit 4 family protein [bacterium]